ncbi:hypothetical protein FHW88_005842 [Mucilaginibacter sp. SG538B]|jgi:hypothetical protein|nr:hypothetical protein [Mucilaginibacter sp. SG538B]
MHVVIERRGVVGDNTNNGEDFKIQFFLSPSLPERDLG